VKTKIDICALLSAALLTEGKRIACHAVVKLRREVRGSTLVPIIVANPGRTLSLAKGEGNKVKTAAHNSFP
jgi:hypothetical protein